MHAVMWSAVEFRGRCAPTLTELHDTCIYKTLVCQALDNAPAIVHPLVSALVGVQQSSTEPLEPPYLLDRPQGQPVHETISKTMRIGRKELSFAVQIGPSATLEVGDNDPYPTARLQNTKRFGN